MEGNIPKSLEWNIIYELRDSAPSKFIGIGFSFNHPLKGNIGNLRIVFRESSLFPKDNYYKFEDFIVWLRDKKISELI